MKKLFILTTLLLFLFCIVLIAQYTKEEKIQYKECFKQLDTCKANCKVKQYKEYQERIDCRKGCYERFELCLHK